MPKNVIKWLMHPDSPGMLVPVNRGWWGDFFKSKDFATLSEASFYSRALALRDVAFYEEHCDCFVRVLHPRNNPYVDVPVYRISGKFPEHSTVSDERVFVESMVFLELVDMQYFGSLSEKENPGVRAHILKEMKTAMNKFKVGEKV